MDRGKRTTDLSHITPRWLIPWISALHVAIYKLTAGRVGSTLIGRPGVLLRTIGRKSGKPHTVFLPYIPDGGTMVLRQFTMFCGNSVDSLLAAFRQTFPASP